MWVMVFLYVMNLHLFSWVSWVWPIILLLGLTWWYLVEGFAQELVGSNHQTSQHRSGISLRYDERLLWFMVNNFWKSLPDLVSI